MLFDTLLRGALTLAAALACQAAAARLPPEVYAALERAKVPPQALSVLVQDAGGTRTRLAWHADTPVNPASLTKLLTTYAALDLLGPAYTWTTPVWLQGSVTDGVLDGIVMCALMERVRPDFRVLTNSVLMRAPEMR